MEKKNYILTYIIQAVLIISCLVLNGIILSNEKASTEFALNAGLEVLALLFAFFYIIYGHRKAVARFFKSYVTITAFAALITLSTYSIVKSAQSILLYLVYALVFGLLVTIRLSLDFGKKKSFVICCIIILAYLVVFIQALVIEAKFISYPVISALSSLILAVNLFIMIALKYADKAERGSK